MTQTSHDGGYAEQEMDLGEDGVDPPGTRARLASIDSRLDAGSRRMTRIEAQLAENTALTRDVRELMEAGRAGLRVLGTLGKLAGWVGKLATAALAIWAFIHAVKNGVPPGK